MRNGLVAALVALAACRSSPPTDTGVVRQVADIALAAYRDALGSARQLEVAIRALVERPSAERLAAARSAWLAARPPYLQTEVFRFSDGPIDAVETLINAWPIDESYIDAVVDAPDAGIINAAAGVPELSRQRLASLNEQGGETNVSVGYHALEFLLWGQDLRSDGAGARPHTDYLPTARHGARRGEYLRQTAGLLVQHLEQVVEAWARDRPANHRAKLLALSQPEALGNILRGLGMLTGPELAGERLTVAYETKDQEDEHSCFSDNTHNDLAYNVIGIQNVYLGRYLPIAGPRLQGAGVQAAVATADRALADRIGAQIEASLAAVRAIPAPFDQAIRGADEAPGRVAVKRAIHALQAQADSLARAAAALKVPLNL